MFIHISLTDVEVCRDSTVAPFQARGSEPPLCVKWLQDSLDKVMSYNVLKEWMSWPRSHLSVAQRVTGPVNLRSSREAGRDGSHVILTPI